MTDIIDPAENVPQATPKWSIPMPHGRASVTPLPPRHDGILVCGNSTMAVYSSGGHRVWQRDASVRELAQTPFGPNDTILACEGDALIARSIATGAIVHRIYLPKCTNVAMTPNGNLVYMEVKIGTAPVAGCISFDGQQRWSRQIEGATALAHGFLPIHDVVVITQNRELWALDQDGQTAWVADSDSVSVPDRGESRYRESDSSDAGAYLSSLPQQVTNDQILMELRSYAHCGLYLVNVDTLKVSPVAVPSPFVGPYLAVPWGSDNRIIGQGGQIEVRPFEYRYQVIAIEADGRPAWQCHLRTPLEWITHGPRGAVIAIASPTPQYFAAYQQFYDLTRSTFLQCIEPDGTTRWLWDPPGPVTHSPTTAPDGTVYIGSRETLWAL